VIEILVEIERLRGLAILMVLCCHFFAFHVDPSLLHPAAYKFFSRQWPGVELFFVLSGFVIGRSLARRFAPNRSSTASLREALAYLVRRAFRVLPPPLFWIAVVAVYVALFDSTMMSELLGSLWAFITLRHHTVLIFHRPSIPYFGPFWSLSVEERFYLGILLVFLIVRHRKMRIVLLVAVMLTILVCFRVYGWTIHGRFLPDAPIWFLARLRFDALLAGTLIALLISEHRSQDLTTSRRLLLFALFLVALVVQLGATTFLENTRWEQFYTNVFYISGGIMVYLAQRNQGLVMGAHGNGLARGFELLGRISFSVYVCHLFVFERILCMGHITKISTWQALALWGPLALAATIFASYLSYSFIESPFRAWGRRLAKSIERSV